MYPPASHPNASPDENRRLMIESSDLSSLHLLHLRFTCQQYLPKAPIPILHIARKKNTDYGEIFFCETKSSSIIFFYIKEKYSSVLFC